MTSKLVVALMAALALAVIVGYAFKQYGDSRVAAERASVVIRAEGIKAEREILDEKLRNQSVADRCKRFGLDYVRDETGERCA